MGFDDPHDAGEGIQPREFVEPPGDASSGDDRTEEREKLEQEQLDAYAATLMEEHHGRKNGNPLTPANAYRAMEGPPGSTPFVGPRGSEGADVRFLDDAGNQVFAREVKTIIGTNNSVDRAIKEARPQLGGGDEVIIQAPDGVGPFKAEQSVALFQRRRNDERLAKYEGINVRLVDRDGNDLYQHQVSQRI